MEVRPLTQEKVKDWDEFCQESDDAWFWHTTDWIEFISRYKPSFKSRNVSFMAYEGARLTAICPLLLEERQGVKEFSFVGEPAPAPALENGLSERRRESGIAALIGVVNEEAKRLQVQRASFKWEPLVPSFLNGRLRRDYLIENGFLPTYWDTRILELSGSVESMWGELRRDHRRNIRAAEGLFRISVLDSSKADRDALNGFCDMYHKVSGLLREEDLRETLFGWVKEGKAVLATAESRGNAVGYWLANTYKRCGYSSMAVNDPEYEGGAIGHLLQWELIKWLKGRDFHWYELGYQFRGQLPYRLVSTKELDISMFKEGFGGSTLPVWAGEKYYSSEYYLQVNSDRTRRYAEYLDLRADQRKGHHSSSPP